MNIHEISGRPGRGRPLGTKATSPQLTWPYEYYC